MKYVLSLLLLTGFYFANAQKTVVPKTTKNQHLVVFDQAMSSGDLGTAIVSLNYYINEKGYNNVFADTLAMLYMQQGLYGQAFYWVEKRLTSNPNDSSLMEMQGICYDKMGKPKEAIDVFEKLFSKTKNPYHAYKLMELQYNIKRLNECLETAAVVEKMEFDKNATITYSFGEQLGRTYLRAGIYNIHALALYTLDRKDDAKKYFEKTLELDGTFALAKKNLEALSTAKPQENKNTGN